MCTRCSNTGIPQDKMLETIQGIRRNEAIIDYAYFVKNQSIHWYCDGGLVNLAEEYERYSVDCRVPYNNR
jgi:hypothetical protein